MHSKKQTFLATLAALTLCTAVQAADPSNASVKSGPELQLSAQVQSSVATDEMTVRMAYEKEGAVVAPLNAEMLKILSDALAQAKKVSGVEAQLSSVQTNPNWDSAGKRKGWRVRGEVVLKSKNTAGLGDLVGRLSEQLQLSGVEYGVSDELAAKSRDALIGQAAKAFKEKAQATATSLGFKGYEVVTVALSDGVQVAPPVMFKATRGMAMSAQAADAVSLPTEGGTRQLSVSFSGTVSLTR